MMNNNSSYSISIKGRGDDSFSHILDIIGMKRGRQTSSATAHIEKKKMSGDLSSVQSATCHTKTPTEIDGWKTVGFGIHRG